MRFFNTAGPVRPEKHYTIPALSRFNLDEILSLIDQEKYFVLHAPRQTGKTSGLLALMDYLNQQGNHRCLYVNVEMGQAAREDVDAAMRSILAEMASSASYYLQDETVKQFWPDILKTTGAYEAFGEMLHQWALKSSLPLVLLIDEIDALVGDTLISVLRQLRAGYPKRPRGFPQSVVLCGVRDVRDYRIHSSQEKSIITGGSAFNIKAKSLRLGNFKQTEVQQLFEQHTEATGQDFEKEALELVWSYTCGQPWLVNALGYEVCFETKANRDRVIPITAEMIGNAKENLILRRETHLDQLVDKLQEERVRKVIEPILAGENQPEQIPQDDLWYVRDLGLITIEGHSQIANRIYQEVIPREMIHTTQLSITHESAWYRRSDGTLDTTKLLLAFQEFFREHSEHWVERFQYKEAGPQLLLQAFLQRVVNAGGRIEREYGLGRMRTDLLVIWRYPHGLQKIVIELKLLHKSLEKTIKDGLEQTAEYMDRCGSKEGYLIVFDRTPDKTWDEKIFHKTILHQENELLVLGM
ncbi:MAG: ATP-binding protein [SAR324 cluster bacterium]|nr:ATP-binding protein [SAR324 cluster bacterium]